MTEEKSTGITYTRRGATGTLALCGSLDIFEADSLRTAALRALEDSKAKKVHLDLAGVERMDISTIQILLALQRDLESSTQISSISTTTPSVAEMLTRMGISFLR